MYDTQSKQSLVFLRIIPSLSNKQRITFQPCLVCTAGVLECFTLSSVYGLDDLYHKCLKWISKYFHIVWPTKAFATLPKELLDKCYQQHVVNMTVENFPDTICGCGVIGEDAFFYLMLLL